AATQAFIAGVAAQLGDNFIQQTLQNDLHTDFVKQGGSFGIQQVGMIMASAMMAGALAPLMAGMVAAQLGSVAATFAAGGLGNVMVSAALTAMTSSAFTQVMYNGSLDFGSVMKSGLSAAITAGLLNGITLKIDDSGMSLGVTGKVSSDSLSSLAGVKPTFVEGAASQAGTASTGFSITQGLAIAGQSVIQAGVQSTIQGGSFLDALQTSGISNIGAALAFQIGEAKAGGLFGDGISKDILSIASHAVLGCAGSAASGNGCAGGAIGAAASAAFTPDFIKGIDPSGAPLNAGQLSALSMLSSLMGAGLSGAAGADANAGAFWAQNQALNNEAGSSEHIADTVKGGLVSSIVGLIYALMPAAPGNPITQFGREQFQALMKAGARAKMLESPTDLFLQGTVNGITAVAGATGGRQPPTSTGAILARSGGGTELVGSIGTPGYVPDNVILSQRGGDEPPSGSGGSNRYDEVFGGRTSVENVTSRGTVIESVKKGNDATALSDFLALRPNDVKTVATGRGDLKMGSLDGGETVILRPSKDGRTTIEFQNSSGRTTREIRYGSK
ncbi:DUF637 domain-containing protein, partial [Pandoraea sp. ISTKB]|uniref:DUF637 domain-containing protein n=1 Tax=Pandoraea sp. ISTKB TaxID=1586708 RepID=UPI0009F3BB6D